jgi:glycosyltransferase involved in cell wall biosynthesis
MKIIFCVEYYHPSVGGAQEVVKQIAERLADRGHEVTVATTKIALRNSVSHNGVRVVEFNLSGNRVKGIAGDVTEYHDFLLTTDADLVFFYAAQQWTFDAAWDILSKISAKKILVPCGYSGLPFRAYSKYFADMPAILAKFDAVIYHAQSYRDIDFARTHGLRNSVVIPNGAAAEEFAVEPDLSFRKSAGIDERAIVLLTVGTATGLKGHLEILHAFALADFDERQALLVLNGNEPQRDANRNILRRLLEAVRTVGLRGTASRLARMALPFSGRRHGRGHSIDAWMSRTNEGHFGNKRVLRVDLPRDQLVQVYLQSDLFVFASNIEYSPLVLYEACAAGLPFLTVPVGNTTEIVAWTGGGEICEAPLDAEGYTRVKPEVLAREMERLIKDPVYLAKLGAKGKIASASRYNWADLCLEYERLFQKLLEKEKPSDNGTMEF